MTNTNAEWEAEFEEVVRPFGAKGNLFLVPDINNSCEMWVITQVEGPIKKFLAETIKKAEQRGRDEAVEYIKEKVGKYTSMDSLAIDWLEILEAARNASKEV